MSSIKPDDTVTPGGWEAPGVNTNLRGKMLLNYIERMMARLEGERQLINAQNKHIMKRAGTIHDHHDNAAGKIRRELLSQGNGDEGSDPTLEDAYGSHLQDRAKMDDLMSLLSHQTKTFVSKTDPNAGNARLTVHPAMNEDEDNAQEDEATTTTEDK
jgi:hypothetical protein